MLARPRWWLGFSGGLDSTVLLYLLRDYLAQQAAERELDTVLPELIAVHVNHGLSPHARAWQDHCQAVCAELGVPCHSVGVKVAAKAKGGLEAAARRARYAAFAALQHSDEVLLLAHHQDDQVETVLLKLFRSSGVDGLAGMRERAMIAGRLRVRPLLAVRREALLAFAKSRELRWIEDESNRDQTLSRNFVRHRVLPLLAEHWPHYQRQLLSVSAAASESVQVLEEVAAEDLARVASRDGWGAKLALEPLSALSKPRIKNAVIRWLHSLGVPALRQRQWPVLFEQILWAGQQRTPTLALSGGSLRRYRGAVYWVPEALCPGSTQLSERFRDPLNDQLNSQRAAPSLALNAEAVAADDLEHSGLLDCTQSGSHPLGDAGVLHIHCDAAAGGLRAGHYRLGWRNGGQGQGGEHRPNQQSSRVLQRAFAAADVPPWWRDRVPLLFAVGAAGGPVPAVAEALAAVGSGYIAPAFRAPATALGVRLTWQRPAAWLPAAGSQVIEGEA